MAINLEPYKRMLAGARRELEASMAGGTASAFTIAVQRGAVAIMAEDLDKRPQTLAAYESRTQNGLTGPDLWLVAARKKTAAPLSPKEVEPEAFWAKTQEYMQIIQVLKERYTTAAHLLVDRKNMHAYLVQENDHVKQALADIAAAMAQWVAVHYADDGFLTAPAIDGLHRMLSERQDLLVTLRVAQQLPKDTNTFVIPPEQRPAALEIIEFGIACIPVVGTAVAIFEATFGYDLFGYELNPVDRVVIAAGAVLPFAGRFVKGGHALYTAARMERLYGQEAARWSLALAAGEKMSEDVVARTAISRARAAIKAGQKVEPALARQVVSALERMALKRGSPRGMPIASYVSDSLKKLISARSVLAELDELTLARVIEKGPNISLMKGQLLEEFLETRVAAWLRDPAGARALGITIPPPHNLEFIPGHLIRDSAGRQITDGVLGYRHNGELITVAIFEAKAGSAAARELRLASSSISSLSAADRAELRAYARDILGSRINRARLRGEKFPKTADEVDSALDKIEREIALSEQGGQVRRDIERLDINEDGSVAVIQVGEDFLPVRISPKQTKVFGVLPKDVKPGNMEQQLQGLGYNFEVLGMNVTQKELVDLSSALRLYVPPEYLLGLAPLLQAGVPVPSGDPAGVRVK